MMSSKGIFNMKNIDYNILSNSLAIAHHRNKFIEGVEYLFANAYFNNIEKDGEIKSERELGLLTKKNKNLMHLLRLILLYLLSCILS